jgi:hypothetical protein
MATNTANLVADNSSLANFKSWAQFISNFFATAGWTQTTDTGQVNWGTIASVPSSTYVYEIWKAADSQASTTPIYVKMEYGFSATLVGIRVTTGTGSNGSGTLTGAIMGPYTGAGTPANQGGTTYPCYASGDSGDIRFMMWQSNATVESIFGIERSKDSSGAKTTDYFSLLLTNAGNANGWVQQTTLGGLVTSAETNFVSVSSSNAGASETFNSTTAANPVFPLIGKLGNPMLGFCMALAADVSEGASVTVSIYGANHTYIATKLGSVQNMTVYSAGSHAGQKTATLMRYE